MEEGVERFHRSGAACHSRVRIATLAQKQQERQQIIVRNRVPFGKVTLAHERAELLQIGSIGRRRIRRQAALLGQVLKEKLNLFVHTYSTTRTRPATIRSADRKYRA